MFDDSRRVDPAQEFPALAAAIAAVDRQGLAAGDGFTSTASWVRGYANLDPAQAVSLVRAARVAQGLPLLAEVLAAGRIGVEHLQAVAGGAGRVPLPVLADHDQTLRNLAPHPRPHDLRVAAAKIQAGYDDTSVADNAAQVAGCRHLSVARTFGDAYHLEGLLPPEAGAALVTALDALMTRRGPEDTRTAGQRRADALSELAELGLRGGQLPETGGDRPRLTFLIRTTATPAPPGPDLGVIGFEATGFEATGFEVTGFGVTDTALIGVDALFPATTIGRICCDADLSVATVNDYGEPLNLGRTSRTPNRGQRRAVLPRDQGCVFPGCDWPPARCQAHHLTYWSAGGDTELAKLARRQGALALA
ncbi:MAG: hypothetical protein QOE76_3582 [Frankiales bacterium]|nr:hypothetical protein [Frankiales bacterium]